MEGFYGRPQYPLLRGRGIQLRCGTVTADRADSFVNISGTWNTSGIPTALKLNVTNTASSASSLLLDVQNSGVTKFNLASDGSITCAGTNNAFVSLFMAVGTRISFTSRSQFKSSADGLLELFNTSGNDFTRINFGGTTSSFPALGKNGVALEVLGADGAAGCNLFVYNTKTSGTNYERFDIQWASNVAQLWTEKGSGGGTARDFVLGADSTEVERFTSAGVKYATAKTISIASGTNQRAGNATLVGGTVTVANTTVTANTIVMLTRKTDGGTTSFDVTYTVSAATSFTITSANILDTSTFSYLLIEVP